MKLHESHPMIRFWHYVGEFVATFVFLFGGSFAIALLFGKSEYTGFLSSPDIRVILVVLAIILISIFIIYSPLGKISGAHMNPAISFSFWVEGHLVTLDFIFYTIAQILAAIGAVYLVSIIIPEAASSTKLGLPHPANEHRVLVEFLAEILGTAVLIGFLFFFLSEKYLVKYTGILMGCYIFFIKLISIEAVSLNLSPSMYLGKAITFSNFHYWWIYIFGPFIGSFGAVMLHRSWDVLRRPKYFRLNHEEGYLEKLFEDYIKKHKKK